MSGIESAIHAMKKSFDEQGCEGVLLVDAENAFNSLNRKAAIHNIQRSCPSLGMFLKNAYQAPSKLFVGDGTFILSKEGATQGDNLAMPMYAVGTSPLISSLRDNIQDVRQVWYADDSSAAGTLHKLSEWWSHLRDTGPQYGYLPNAGKTILIVKSPELLERAQEVFAGQGIQITAEGSRHLGSALGTDDFKESYVTEKVRKWVSDVQQLSEIAKEEPQAVLCAFNTGVSLRWRFLQRTTSNIGHLFEPLETCIRNELIPALFGRSVSDTERRLLALPYRFGGMGLSNPVSCSQLEYDASVQTTRALVNVICGQENGVEHVGKGALRKTILAVKAMKEATRRHEFDDVMLSLSEATKRLVLAAAEKGASSWLSALPIGSLGYAINKQEFRDAVALRYGWTVSEMPRFCACGAGNSIDHALVCKKGGYVSLRHNSLRDAEAKLMESVCKDVRKEPALLSTNREDINGNKADGARLDISAIGVWNQYERAFFDVRISHPNADSHINKSLQTIYTENERQKKAAYNDRVIHCERGTFTPLVFLTSGGMGPECQRLNKRLAELISQKKGERYSDVMAHVRTKLRFCLLKATVAALRGVRGRQRNVNADESSVDDIDFNLIPRDGN